MIEMFSLSLYVLLLSLYISKFFNPRLQVVTFRIIIFLDITKIITIPNDVRWCEEIVGHQKGGILIVLNTLMKSHCLSREVSTRYHEQHMSAKNKRRPKK